MRCPKCGKTITDNVTQCPVCHTKIVSSQGADSSNSNYHRSGIFAQYNAANLAGGDINYHQSGVFAQSNTRDKVKNDINKMLNNKKAIPKKSKKPVAIAIAVASAAAFIAIAVIGLNLLNKNNDDKSISKSDGESYETVNSKLSELLSESGNDTEKLKEQIGSALEDLSENGMVKDVKFVDETSMYEFTYDDGTQGGVMTEPFSEEMKGTQKNYAQKDSSGKVVSYDNHVKIDKSKYTYSKSPKAKVMYGLNMPNTLSDMKKRNDVWNSNGLKAELDEECTVRDFQNDLKGYDYIEIDEHGTIYDQVPVICLDENVTVNNRKEYIEDLKEKNIVEMHYIDIKNNPYHKYWIKPSFFKAHYGGNGLSGCIFYLGCCYGYQKTDLAQAIVGAGADAVLGYNDSVYASYDYFIQDTLVYSLLYGDTVSDALAYAKGMWGKNDADWYRLYYGNNKTSGEPAELRIHGDPQKTLVEIKNAEAAQSQSNEKTVPEIVKKVLGSTDPAAALKKNEHIENSKDYSESELWFQDMDGDGKPDLVVGGNHTTVDYIQSASLRCYDVQLSSGNGGGIIIVFPDYSHKKQYGHDSFALQAYKDKNGSLIFTQDQFHAYTSPDPERDPKYAGAFHMYEYSFANGKGDSDKKEILHYSYDSRFSSMKDYPNCSDGKGNRISGVAARQLLNNYVSSKTPLRANVKKINYQNYMNNMTQEKRKQALMDSYYAFSYTEDRNIQPYGKDIIEKIVAAEAKAATTTTTTNKPQQTDADIYASYASAVESFKSKHSDHTSYILYFVYDIDSDNSADLVVWDMQGFSVNRHVAIYKYDASSHQAKLYAEGEMGGSVSYSKKSRSLVSFYSHGRVDYNTCPSGMYICVTKGVISGGKISDKAVVSGDSEENKAMAQQYHSDIEQGNAGQKVITASDIKANAVKNKAA